MAELYSKFKRTLIKENKENIEFIYYKGDFSKDIDYVNDSRFKEVKNKRKQLKFLKLVNMKFFNPTEEFLDELANYIGDTFVFEIGCGESDLLEGLAKRGVKCVGIDPYSNIELDPEIHVNVLPVHTDEGIKLIEESFKSKFEKIIILVARPCHSDFVNEYFNCLRKQDELIYIGLYKNVEIDLDRDMSVVKPIPLPPTNSHECVLSFKHFHYEGKDTRQESWEKYVDKYNNIRELPLDEDLVNWIKEHYSKKSEYYNLTKGDYKSSIFGSSNYEKVKDSPLLYSDILKKRRIKYSMHQHMGFPHFYVDFEVADDLFLFEGDAYGFYSLAMNYDDPLYEKITSYRDSKRLLGVPAMLIWIKQSFEETQKLYKEKYGVDLYPIIDSDFIDEIEKYKKYYGK